MPKRYRPSGSKTSSPTSMSNPVRLPPGVGQASLQQRRTCRHNSRLSTKLLMSMIPNIRRVNRQEDVGSSQKWWDLVLSLVSSRAEINPLYWSCPKLTLSLKGRFQLGGFFYFYFFYFFLAKDYKQRKGKKKDKIRQTLRRIYPKQFNCSSYLQMEYCRGSYKQVPCPCWVDTRIWVSSRNCV